MPTKHAADTLVHFHAYKTCRGYPWTFLWLQNMPRIPLDRFLCLQNTPRIPLDVFMQRKDAADTLGHFYAFTTCRGYPWTFICLQNMPRIPLDIFMPTKHAADTLGNFYAYIQNIP